MLECNMHTPRWRNHHRRIRLISLIFPILASGQACSWLNSSVLPGGILYQDDFSRESSGWDRYQDEIYRTDYVKGEYKIFINSPSTEAWSRPRIDVADVTIQVEAYKSDGPDNNIFGVLCRYHDADNFYFFLISSDGYSGIGEYRQGVKQLLSSDTMLPHESIQQGEATNYIRADCVGSHLALFVNGIRVAEALADDQTSGDVGLLAGAYEEPGAVIGFDNFTTLKP